MQIKSRVMNKTLYILLSGELDEYTAKTVRKELDTLFDTEKGFVQIVLDLSELTFMDSTGVGVLIGRYKKMIEYNKPIFISNPSRNAERIFKMSGLYEIMPKIVWLGDNMKNLMELKFKAVPENESFARSVAAGFLMQMNPTLEEIEDVKTAVSEAVTNSIVHAYPDKPGMVTMRMSIKDNDVHISVIDNGIGIVDIQKALSPFYTSKPDQERSGMGFTVIEAFMDALEVKNSKDGLIVNMRKKISSAEAC